MSRLIDVEVPKRACEVSEKIRELLPTLRTRTLSAGATYGAADRSLAELAAAGFFRLLQPERWGGIAGDPVDFYDTVITVADTCASTGWVAAMLGVQNWHVGLFDPRAQEAVWGSNPDTRIAASYGQTGEATRCDGGYLVHGVWKNVVGCEHSDWVLLAGQVRVDGHVVDGGVFLLPQRECSLASEWIALGIGGSGSHTITVREVFVPDNRFRSQHRASRTNQSERQADTAPVYALPRCVVQPSVIAAVTLGVVLGLLNRLEQRYPASGRLLPAERISDPGSIAAIRRATNYTNAARSRLLDTTAQQFRYIQKGWDVPLDLVMRAQNEPTRIVRESVAMVQGLFADFGPAADIDTLRRAWWDVRAASAHLDYGARTITTSDAGPGFGDSRCH